MRLQLRETSFSVNNFALLLDRHGNVNTTYKFHSIAFYWFGRAAAKQFVALPEDRGDAGKIGIVAPSGPNNVSNLVIGRLLQSIAAATVDAIRWGIAILAQTEKAARFTANCGRLS